ncbi:MAG: hypothetical protein WBW84_22845 [Acidobacteriaceae bacterium]
MDTSRRAIGGDGNKAQEKAQSRWRLTGLDWALGCGLIVLGVALWLLLRPAREAPWNDRAIAADFQTLRIEKPVAPEEAGQTPGDVHVIFLYRLRNLTNKAYQMPEPRHGVLMKSVTGGGWQEVDSVLWDRDLTIPAGKAADVEFDMAIPSTDEDAAEDPQQQKDLVAAGMARLRPIRELAFFDYAHRYVIHLPKGWG